MEIEFDPQELAQTLAGARKELTDLVRSLGTVSVAEDLNALSRIAALAENAKLVITQNALSGVTYLH
jgi:hypothetical protein